MYAVIDTYTNKTVYVQPWASALSLTQCLNLLLGGYVLRFVTPQSGI